MHLRRLRAGTPRAVYFRRPKRDHRQRIDLKTLAPDRSSRPSRPVESRTRPPHVAATARESVACCQLSLRRLSIRSATTSSALSFIFSPQSSSGHSSGERCSCRISTTASIRRPVGCACRRDALGTPSARHRDGHLCYATKRADDGVLLSRHTLLQLAYWLALPLPPESSSRSEPGEGALNSPRTQPAPRSGSHSPSPLAWRAWPPKR